MYPPLMFPKPSQSRHQANQKPVKRRNIMSAATVGHKRAKLDPELTRNFRTEPRHDKVRGRPVNATVTPYQKEAENSVKTTSILMRVSRSE